MSKAEVISERVRDRLAAFAERPFPSLVLHFAGAIFKGTQDTEMEIGIGGILGLLAVPGALLSIMLLDKYSSLLAWLRRRPMYDVYVMSIPDKYFFIVFAMVVTGLVTVLRWDRIFPGRIDFLNLAPLPVSMRRLFTANLMAVLLLAAVFAVDINLFSTILFPMVVTADRGSFTEYAGFVGAHAVAVLLASGFVFFSSLALMGGLMSILPPLWFRRISLYVRTGLVVVLLAGFGFPRSWRTPPVWFLDLYQWLQGRKGSPELALKSAAIAFGLALFFYAVSYRRYFLRIPESGESGLAGKVSGWKWPVRAAERWLLPTAFQRACFWFSLRTLQRSEGHCIVFGGFAGLGLVMAAQGLIGESAKPWSAIPSREVLALPFLVAYPLIAGLRFVLEMPVGLKANWVFQSVLDGEGRECSAVARKLMLAFWIPLVMIPSLIGYGRYYGWGIAVVHCAVVAALCATLIELLVVRFRKIPFTCSLPQFGQRVTVVAALHLVSFAVFATLIPGMERWMFDQPGRFIGLAIALGFAWDGIRRLREDVADVDTRLLYQEVDEGTSGMTRLFTRG